MNGIKAEVYTTENAVVGLNTVDCTILSGRGFWIGQEEASVVVVIVATDERELDAAVKVVVDMAIASGEDAVLVTKTAADVRLELA